MNLYSVLEPILLDVIKVISPLQADRETRLAIMSELRDVVVSVESLRGATVEPFGSFLSNLFTRGGDLDISVDLPNSSYISSAGKKRKQNFAWRITESFEKERFFGEFRKLQLIANARVPILKLESNHQNISCDISIDNMAGQMKSLFLSRNGPKAHNINNPKNGTLNSYSLSLLVVFHFQVMLAIFGVNWKNCFHYETFLL
ncbi:hypothetical protein Patl1_06447 [Pistacia atlantica]|uniref:Uncharacterized protein n=1 Tax=Pistacia atlantica TaxID=434234 RepID=A0ACC1BWX5_9ROSI|nr:hypothetical protein Patl1_06447 [Pistacia atlantica]